MVMKIDQKFNHHIGTPNVLVEKYIIDPYDRTRPAPSQLIPLHQDYLILM